MQVGVYHRLMVDHIEVREQIRQIVDHVDVEVYQQQMVGSWRLELSTTVGVVAVHLNNENWRCRRTDGLLECTTTMFTTTIGGAVNRSRVIQTVSSSIVTPFFTKLRYLMLRRVLTFTTQLFTQKWYKLCIAGHLYIVERLDMITVKHKNSDMYQSAQRHFLLRYMQGRTKCSYMYHRYIRTYVNQTNTLIYKSYL